MTSQTFWWFPNQGCDRTNVLLNDNYDTVIENRISILAARGYKGLVLPPKPLKIPISGVLSQPSFKDNGIFEVTVSCKWLRLTSTRGQSSVTVSRHTNTVGAWQGGKCAERTWPTEPPHSAAAGEEEGPEAGKQTWEGQESHPMK